MYVLVMGGTEFVSCAIAKHLISQNHKVDIFTRGIKPVEYGGFNRHLRGDRKSNEDLHVLLKNSNYEIVIDISVYTKDDIEKLLSVLNRDQLKRYVFCSSGGVYQHSNDFISEDFPRGENVNWGVYGLNKKMAEDYLFELHEKDGFPITIFRPTYIYGEGNNLYREGYFFDRIMQDKEIPIPWGHQTKTQFIYIDDLVRVFESALYNQKTIGKAYNVTYPETVSWDKLAKTAMKVNGNKVDLIYIDSKNLDRYNIEHVRRFFPFRDVTYLLNIDSLTNDGLYIPQINLERGLDKSYKWYCIAKPNLSDTFMTKVDHVIKLSTL